MKSKLFLTVLLLAVITTIGISQDKQPHDTKDKTAKVAAQSAKIEEERIAKLPQYIQSLAGVKGVCVLIEALNKDVRATGLTREQLQADVELQLVQVGIKVNSWEEYHASEDGAYIFVNINTAIHNDSPTIVSSICVDLTQKVRLLRSPFTMVLAKTWERQRICMFAKSEFPEEARKQVKACMDKFIRHYLTANPKK